MSSFCHGVAAAQSLDKSGEIVDIKGLDISSLASTGIVNYEHKSDIPGQICGKILTAKKIFNKDDCSNGNELYFWNKTKNPFVYIIAELLDDYCQSGKDAAGILKYDYDKKDQNKNAILGFSIEGSEIPNSRGSNRMVVARGIARKTTLTSAPCNSQCVAELLVDAPKSKIKEDFDEIFKSEANAIEMFKSGEGSKIYESYLAKKEAEGPSQGGKPPKNPYQEYQAQGIRPGKNSAGETTFSHGNTRPYKFNPAEHQHSGEHHKHSIVTAQNPKLGDNKAGRAVAHKTATASGGRIENRAALSLNDKTKIGLEQGKQQVAKKEKDTGRYIGLTKSGKEVYSHGDSEDYDFSPEDHKEAAEHHRHAAVTATNPEQVDHHLEQMKAHNRASLAKSDKMNSPVFSTVAGKNLRSGLPGIKEGMGTSHMGSHVRRGTEHNTGRAKEIAGKELKRIQSGPHPDLGKSEPSGWSKGKVSGDSVHYDHPEHGPVTIQKQPSGEFHVKHHGALAGVEGVKGVFSGAKEAGKHARKYMQGVSTGKVLPNRAHNHSSPSMVGKTELKKAIEAGSYNAAPSTLVNGAAYQTESLGSKPTNTGAEENTFHGTKKKDWNRQAKDDYDRWPHKDKFEKFMKARMPHLADGEIRAIGRVISLKKSIDFEKSLSELSPLKKSQKIDLVHYSSHPSLEEVDPKFHGTGVDARTKGRDTWHPHSFYYRAGSEPESVVTGRSPHRYHASIDAKEHPLYDIGSDPEGHVKNSLNMESVHEKLKEKGYHGFHNSKHDTLSHVVAMYHPVKVQKEKGIKKAEQSLQPPKPPHPSKPEVKINPEHGKTIANAYENMKHDPNHPDVKAAYNALIGETGNQFKKIAGSGLKISQIKAGQSNPYKNSKEMHHDISQNNHLWYFPTEQGFGTEANQAKDHPMLAPTEFSHEGKPLLANDVFRIVHDINGHHVGGMVGFGPKGEHEAYLQHKKMYSPLANKALASETMGQNNWVNFSDKHGESNRKDPSKTVFAEQKAGLLPEHIINGRWHQ